MTYGETEMPTFNEQDHPRGHPDNAGSFTDRSFSAPEVSLGKMSSWPAITYEPQTWAVSIAETGPDSALGSRFNGPYESAVPPSIADIDVELSSDTLQLAEAATEVLVRFDSELGSEIAPFASLLLRSEAVASSRIENLTASARSILSAELGVTGKPNATVIAANTRSMQSALELADALTPESVLEMHRTLMLSEPNHTPGHWREEPVWIGTSGVSPIGATFVAPDAGLVPELMDDVMTFARRDDLPRLAQAAIAHAQFETIHPFTDGNGRTGRALIQSMLRGKGLTQNVTIPVSAGLLTNTGSYHAALTSYREGDVEPLVRLMSEASLLAVTNARQLVREVHQVQERWRSTIKARSDSAVWRVLDLIARQPVITAESVATHLGIAPTNAYVHLKTLTDAGVLQAKTEHKQGRFWRSDAILGTLDDFAVRAGRRGYVSTSE
jgi:Fic family protein